MSEQDRNNDEIADVNSRDVASVRNQLKVDDKRESTQSMTTFLATAVIGVPLWLTLLVPLTAVYQIGKKIIPGSSEDDGNGGENNASAQSIATGERIALLAKETFPDVKDFKPLEDRKYDVVLLGSTGFTGGIAARYIAQQYGSGMNTSTDIDGQKKLKWAIAGRSQTKLDAVISDISKNADGPVDVDTIVVDTSKPSTLHALVNDTKAVITTAGPFCKYGSNVVAFCAHYGTNYVDITGETGWNKEMMMEYNQIAKQTGAKIVSFCGCDSIPWDMTVYKLRQLMREECKDEIAEIKCYNNIKGGVSGGTIDTMLTFLEGKYKEPKFEYDPYYQTKTGTKSIRKSRNDSPTIMTKTPNEMGSSSWTSPFVMTAVNAEIIKRSHALDDDGQSTSTTGDGKPPKPLSYQEYQIHPTFKEAFITWFGTIFSATALLNPITGMAFKTFLLPKPGEGPDEKSRDRGYLLVSGRAEGANGSRVESELYFPGDPGYKETARMVAESGLCLALDLDKLPIQGGGFFSPSIAMGDVLLERLCKTGSKFASKVLKSKL